MVVGPAVRVRDARARILAHSTTSSRMLHGISNICGHEVTVSRSCHLLEDSFHRLMRVSAEIFRFGCVLEIDSR